MIKDTLITHNEPKSPVSEAYRVLRTNLQFTSLDTPLKVIAVTSAGPGEGKSTTVSNLAITFAQSGSSVLIIDADLRKPSLHKLFGIANRFGTTNAVVTPDNYESYIQQTPVSGLSLMTSGPIPPNPSELLGSNKMKQLLGILKEHYDVILIDTPPVAVVTDAQIMATLADGIIIVAASGSVMIEALIRAKELLGKVNANILGVVLNKLQKETNQYYYYYYYTNSYEEGAPTKEKKRKRRFRK